MKRYCQALELYDDSELTRTYVAKHQHVWSGIRADIRKVGILDMQIYIHEHTLLMIVDTVDEFDWIKGGGHLAKLSRRVEREAYMSRFQRSLPRQASYEE